VKVILRFHNASFCPWDSRLRPFSKVSDARNTKQCVTQTAYSGWLEQTQLSGGRTMTQTDLLSSLIDLSLNQFVFVTCWSLTTTRGQCWLISCLALNVKLPALLLNSNVSKERGSFARFRLGRASRPLGNCSASSQQTLKKCLHAVGFRSSGGA